MTRNEQLAAVVRLACETSWRADDEQRALIALAWESDVAHNRLTTTNRALKPGWQPQNLVEHVIDTRVLDDGQREIAPPNGWEKRWEAWSRDLARSPELATMNA